MQDIGSTEAKTRSLPNSSEYNSHDIAARDLNGNMLVDLVGPGWRWIHWLDSFKDSIIPVSGSGELLVNNAGTGFDNSNVKTLIPLANLPIVSIDVGDHLNGDEMIDLVFRTVGSNFIIINKGGGKFMEAIDLPAGGDSSTTQGIVIVDVNNNSGLYIVIANYGCRKDEVLLNLLPNDSTSAFGAALGITKLTGEAPYTSAMALRYFKQSRFIDIEEGNKYQANTFLLNNGEGSFDVILLLILGR